MMHKRVDKLLSDLGDKICVQYIFGAFSKELEDSARHLIGIYLNKGTKAAEEAYNEWFDKAKEDKVRFFRRYGQDIETAIVQDEHSRHVRWIEENKLNGTPTILVNGYILPDIYKIEDMKFFTDLDSRN